MNLGQAKPVKKRTKNDELQPATTRKNSTPIVQLMPPPQKVNHPKWANPARSIITFTKLCSFTFPQTLNEKRVRLETNLSKLMCKLRAENEDMQPVDLSYLLTGRGTRRRTNVTNVPLKH